MKQRFIYGGIAAVFFLGMLLWSGSLFYLLLLLMALIGFNEFVRLFQISRKEWIVWVGALYVAYMVQPWLSLDAWISDQVITWLLILIIFMATVTTKNRIHVGHSAFIFIGALYVGFGFQAMVQVHWMHGALWTLMIFGCIWMTDIGAYLSGRWFGKHLLWPAISPKKTIEGSLGGIFFSLLTAVIFQVFFDFVNHIGHALIIGFIIAIFAQLGDLIQSAYKRHAGVKDSGALIPGHGGILDRCDSWIVVFPIIYYIGVNLS